MRDESKRLSINCNPWYLTRKQIMQLTGMSRDTIDRLERRGAFPKRILLSGRKVCWDLAEIEAWHQERKDARGGQRHEAESRGALS